MTAAERAQNRSGREHSGEPEDAAALTARTGVTLEWRRTGLHEVVHSAAHIKRCNA